jgi:hypothetical protein
MITRQPDITGGTAAAAVAANRLIVGAAPAASAAQKRVLRDEVCTLPSQLALLVLDVHQDNSHT